MEKRRTILIGLVLFVLISLVFSSAAQAAPAQSPTISVSPASMAKSQGDTFTIEIVVDPKGEEIYALQYDLYISNPSILNATSQTQGIFLSQDGVETDELINEINSSTGKVEYGETRTGKIGITSAGVVASVSFEVIGTSGTSDLKLSNVILTSPNVESIETEIYDGTCTVGEPTGEPAVTDITAEEAHQMLEEKPEEIILLDVRTEKEYTEEHIPDAINIPLSELESRIGELDEYKSKKIIVYCLPGGRSRTASETLVQHGFQNVYNMLGGIQAWRVHRDFPLSTSPSLSPSPTPAASSVVSPTPTPTIGGFEAALVVIDLLAISYLISKSGRKGDRNK